jgi:predicted 3-demethylubiquinone-9 3-methyltransferase (glyoxalase superfamily)
MKMKEANNPTMRSSIEKGNQKITPFLWFNDEAEEAVKFYTSLLKNSQINKVTYYSEEGREFHGMPAGSVMTIGFQLEGHEFVALNGGTHFKFTPAISFFVNCDSPEEVGQLWAKLSKGGTALMELDKYPFSEKYGWMQDKYGLSWQLNLADSRQKIIPSLLFVGEQNGKAEEAIKFYTSLFDGSSIGFLSRYKKGEGGTEGTLNYASFTLNGQEFVAMDSSLEHAFNFNEATSFVVNCETQEQIDKFWNKLSEGGDERAQQCGWLKDKFGVSWQVVPRKLPEMLNDPNEEKAKRVMNAMLRMKKFNMRELEQAYNEG